jgi:CheY-like chemotaxis protein
MVLHEDVFDLERTLHELIMLMLPTARDKGLELLVDYDMFLSTQFTGDRGRIRQIITNLMGNAVKFTEEGHVLVRVVGMPQTRPGKAKIHITIEDTGIGIPEDKVKHIFGEFNQVNDDRNRKYEGTGLGLAISEKLIRMMGGEIWVHSKEGEGSSFGFSLHLPMAEDPVPEFTRNPGNVRLAIVVEPHDAGRSILEKQLDVLGIETVLTVSGAEALDHMKPNVDLIITDHHMPGMDGMELAEAIRERGSSASVIVLSDSAASAENDPAIRYVHSVLQRPVARHDLFRALKSLDVRERDPSETDTLCLSGPPIPEPESRRKLRVLAAEDNKTNRLVFSKMIKSLDIDLQFAENGREAVDLFSSFRPDIIFTDISMPEMDGTEATRRIRAIEEPGTHVPVIAMTAHAMDGDEQGILASGIDRYLTKPLKKDAIIKHILDAWSEPMLHPLGADQPS